MSLHMIKESNLHKTCYCGKDLTGKDWKSDTRQGGDIHYKTTVCECGCELRIKVDFRGSGHDSMDRSWVPTNKDKKVTVKTIENIVSQLK